MNVLAATIPNPGGGPRARLKTGTQAPRKTRRRRATPASSPISPITNGRPRPARLKGTVPFRFASGLQGALEEVALDGAVGAGEGLAVGGAGLVEAAEAAQQCGARGVQQVVV